MNRPGSTNERAVSPTEKRAAELGWGVVVVVVVGAEVVVGRVEVVVDFVWFLGGAGLDPSESSPTPAIRATDAAIATAPSCRRRATRASMGGRLCRLPPEGRAPLGGRRDGRPAVAPPTLRRLGSGGLGATD